MTEKPAPKIVVVLLVTIAIGLFAALVSVATSDIESRQTRSCMDSVVEPDPESEDYDYQSLVFMSEVRKCMRG